MVRSKQWLGRCYSVTLDHELNSLRQRIGLLPSHVENVGDSQSVFEVQHPILVQKCIDLLVLLLDFIFQMSCQLSLPVTFGSDETRGSFLTALAVPRGQ